MIKIAMCIRNRLEVTKHTIEAIKRYTKFDYQLYLYDNLTSYRVQDHFDYMHELLSSGVATQITFNTKQSTFDAFSKVVALNSFGRLHEEDPKKNEIEFIVLIDNDIIVQPGWDMIISQAWQDVNSRNLVNIKVIGQHPGGIKDAEVLPFQVAGYDAIHGKFGGSGFWCVRSNFYEDIGFLDIVPFIGCDKKHDQNYWAKLNKATNHKRYIMVLKAPIVLNAGGMAGSICNVIGRGHRTKKALEKIKYIRQDKLIGLMTFKEFILSLKRGGARL